MPKRTLFVVASVILVVGAGLAVFLFLTYGAYAELGGAGAGAIALLGALQRRSAADSDPQAGNTQSFPVGAYFTISFGAHEYRIAKLLVHEHGICHLRVYKQTFASRPAKIDVDQLTLGSMNDADSFGMGRIPLSESSFLASKPVFVARAVCYRTSSRDTLCGRSRREGARSDPSERSPFVSLSATRTTRHCR